jgi:hypothetical protein
VDIPITTNSLTGVPTPKSKNKLDSLLGPINCSSQIVPLQPIIEHQPTQNIKH